MKKVIVLLLISLAAISFADVIRLNYGVGNGYYFSGAGVAFDPETTLPTPGLGILGPDGSGKDTWLQLISTGANGKRDWAGTGLNTFWANQSATIAGDDVVLASCHIVENDIVGDDADNNFLTYAYTAVQTYRAPYTAGSVYVRLFQDATPDAGDWYAFSEVVAFVDQAIYDPVGSIELAVGGFLAIDDPAAVMDPTTNSGLAGSVQVIPEPATLLLFGIGGMIAWILRHRQQA